MFFRRSPRHKRSSGISSIVRSVSSRWNFSNVDRVFSAKHGYSRRLMIEPLEDRRLLTVNVYFDNVNNQIAIVDDYDDDILQTGGEGPTFSGANHVQEDNDVTLSNGIDTPGRLRIFDPLGVILDPEIIIAGDGTQISDTVVEIDATALMRVDLQGGNDRLIFNNNFNAVTTLTTMNLHGGDPGEGDGLIMNATDGVAETVTVTTDDNDQDEQDITGYAGKTFNVRGYESILYDGSGSNDSLIVDLGFGEATARVQNSSPADTDEVVSSTLPTVLFTDLNNFTLRGDPGESTAATFVIDSLAGSTTYTFASEHQDSLIIEGNGGANAITATLNAGNLRVSANGNNIDTTGMNAGDLLQVNTLGGNDSLLVNISGIAPISTPIEFVGGSGTDVLLVQGTPVPAIVDVVYTPRLQPDEGRLEYRGAAGARLMSIDFDDLEPVVDLVGAPLLIINGTPAANAITYAVGANSGVTNATNPTGIVTGQVTIDNSESIEFGNKTAVVVNGLSGDDVIVADNGTIPAALNNITFNGDFGNDTIRIENLPAVGGTFASATANGGDGNDVIDASLNPNATPLTLNGGAGNDTITGGLGNDTITGGTGNDTIIVSPGNDNLDGGNGTDDDALVIRGTVDANVVTVQQGAAANTLNITVDGVGPGTNTIADFELFRIELGDGNDQLILDLPNAQLITLGNNRPIFYDGGTGINSLTVGGAFGGGTIDSVAYTPGSQVDEGRLLYNDGLQVMDVRFDNLAPILELAAAATLLVNGTPAPNSITYRQGSETNRGLVTVDGFELIQFSNKVNLTLNGDAGDDTVVLDNGAIPTALATITVNADLGNDNIHIENLPAAGGTFTGATVNGGDGNDVIDASLNPNATPLTLNGGAGNDTITGGLGNDTIDGGTGNDTIIISLGTDSLDGGDAADDDALVLRGTVDADNFVVRQLAAANQLEISFNGGTTFFTNTIADFEHFRIELGDDNDQLTIDLPNAQLITSVGAIFFDGGTGADTLTVQGAFGAASIDSVVYTPGLQVDEGRLLYTDAAQVMDITFDNIEPVVDTADAALLTINGNGSANAITVIQDPAAATRALVSRDGFETMSFNNKVDVVINALGGDDVVDVNIAAAAVITALATLRINANEGNDTVRFQNLPTAAGFTSARVDGGAGNDIIDASAIPTTTTKPLTLNGDEGNDTITGGAGADTINGGTGNDTIIISPGNDNIDGGDATDDDQLVLRGTVDGNTVLIEQQAAANQLTFTIDGAAAFTDTIADLEHFRIELGDGNDQLTISVPNAQLLTLVTNKPIFYDGGTGADTLTVQGAFGAETINTVVYTPGLQADEGRLLYTDAAQIMDIGFDNIEPVVDTTEAALFTINANGAANAITLNQDAAVATRGFVSIDGFETMSFNNKTDLIINALGGDDIVNVNIPAAAVITGLATFRINANDGNDTVRLHNLPTVAGFTSARVDGGSGNDIIDASNVPVTTVKPLTLNGDEGNDTITGAAGVDTITGGLGDDTLIDSPGNDIYNGDTGVDTLVIRGTAINDILSFVQNAPVGAAGSNYTVNIINGPLAAPPAAAVDQIVPTTGAAPSDPANRPSVERILIEALAGDDAITVAHNDAYSDLDGANGVAAQTITVQVVGDSPNASDRLVVQDNGIGDLVIHREGPDRRSGSIVVGGMAPITYETTERVDIIPLNNAGQTGTPPGGRLLVFKDDDLETNESATNASPFGLEPAFIGQRNIDPGAVSLPPFGQIPGDEDWYEFRPLIPSLYRFDIFFEHIATLPSGRPGLPEQGDLRLDVFRADGTLIASSDTSGITPINVDSKESVTISLNPAITQSVFVRVKGSFLAGGEDPEAPSPAINIYDIAATEVDEDGPVVFDPDGAVEAIFPNNLVDFDIFAPKPDNLLAGATPQIFSLTINLRDIPIGPFPGDPLTALDIQSATQPGIYRVAGDHVGIIDISSVELLNNFQVNGDVDAAPAPSTTSFRDGGLVGQNIPPLTGQQTLVGAFIQFTSGANSGQVRTISAYDPATGQITVSVALPAAPAAGDDFTITSINHAQVRLNFREALPDDRFTLTLLDSITDPGGNRLDGESDAPEPGTPTFPSGNGLPGGIFQARFTVDTRPEVGAAVGADIDIDINGNYVWDPANGQIGNDATNVDISFTMTVQNGPNGPLTTGGFNVNDLVFSGRFTNNGEGLPNRLYDQLGIYGFAADTAPQGQRWLVDLNGDGIITTGSDIFTFQPSLGATFNVAGAIPIAGNFAAGFAGDEVGLFNAGKWGLDTNHDFVIQASEVIQGSITGIPFVGDFDGDGLDDLATFNNNTFFFDFRANGFGGNDANISFWGFPGVLDRPIAADIDQDGIDDVGLWAPRNSASLPREVSEWYFLMSDAVLAPVTDKPELVTDNATTTSFFASNLIGETEPIQGKLIRFLSGANAGQIRTVTAFNSATGRVTFNSPLASAPLNGDIFSIGGTTNTLETLNHAFSPIPFGNDIYAEFGDELAMPLIGNFDPPVDSTPIAPNTGISGDYDNSGGVNGGDYNAWKSKFGSNSGIANGNGDSKTDAADYVLWRKFFGPGAPGSPEAGPSGGESGAGGEDSPPVESGAAPAAAAGPAAATAPSPDVTYEDVSTVTTVVSMDASAEAPTVSVGTSTTEASQTVSTRIRPDYRPASVDRYFDSPATKMELRGRALQFKSEDENQLLLIAARAAQAPAGDDFAELDLFAEVDEASFDDSEYDVEALDAVFQTL